MDELGKLFLESITEPLRVICTLLAFLIPYTVYTLNNWFHQQGDQPWKKEKQDSSR